MNKVLRYSLILTIIFSLIIFALNATSVLLFLSYGLSLTALTVLLTASALIAGLVITYIIIATAPVVKNYLKTFRQLLRLDTLSHPLLLRLQKEAPATFNHSLQVANLANRAAKAIKADSLLARIGGYYHDIGKLIDPEFFIENRKSNQFEHDDINPQKLSLQIKNHVKQGIKLAHEYNLPQEVIAFIPEHHGTMVVSYLYDKAKKMGLKPNKKDYRYQGPKPLSKETAILMMSDATESKLRTMKTLTPSAIKDTIEKIIQERLKDGQFELSGLTEHDISQIKTALVEGVKSNYHQRIKYPNEK